MQSKIIKKDICLFDGTKIKIDINIPLSDDVPEERINDELFDDILINQLLQGLKDSIAAYKNSELPNSFLHPQKIIITNILPMKLYGAFNIIGDDIIVDADAISNIRRIGNGFLFGHEMGHKIDKYRNTEEAYQDIARSLSISENALPILKEIYADICGLIVANSNEPSAYLGDVSNDRCEYLKGRVLKNIYHI